MAKSTCKASFSIGDDYGDNSTTFHCQRTAGHYGWHLEEWKLNGRCCEFSWIDTRTRKEKLKEWWQEMDYRLWSWWHFKISRVRYWLRRGK